MAVEEVDMSNAEWCCVGNGGEGVFSWAEEKVVGEKEHVGYRLASVGRVPQSGGGGMNDDVYWDWLLAVWGWVLSVIAGEEAL
jgi:hypothetical protein